MMDNFDEYESMREAGVPPEAVYVAGRKNGLDFITSVRMLRRVFGFDLGRAKEVTVVAEKLAPDLSTFQERLKPDVEEALKAVKLKE